MRLVNKQDDRRGARLDVINHLPQAVFKLAFHAGTGLQQTQVQRTQGDISQDHRHITRHDLACQPLYHRCFTHPRFTRQNGIVLPPPHQDIDHLAYLGITPQHRIDLAGTCLGCEVYRVFIQSGSTPGSRLGRLTISLWRLIASGGGLPS